MLPNTYAAFVGLMSAATVRTVLELMSRAGVRCVSCWELLD